MVNKAVVGLLLGGVIVAVLVTGVVGILISDGSNAPGTATPTDLQPTPLATDTASPSSTPSSTSTSTSTAREPTPSADVTTVARTTIAADEFQPREIERAIRKLVNQRRNTRGLEPLSRTKEPVTRLNFMARNHSQEMAKINDVRHKIDGRSTGDRYRQYDVYGTCRWKASGENYVIRADNPRSSQLEAVGMTMAGRPYTENGQPRFNGNETAVARVLVEEWFDGYPDESKFYLEKASQMGVGVHVTLSGEVYATVTLC